MPARPTTTEGDGRSANLVAPREEHERGLGREDERAVRVRGDAEEQHGSPGRPGRPRPAIESAEKEQERQEREEEEEAVHPRVDAVEEEDPAAGDECGRDQRAPAVGESPPEQRHERQARDRERCRDEAHPSEPESEMRDRPGEEEVERGPAALARDVLDDAREAVAADEERERLVLVRRPGHQLVEEERAGRERDRAHGEPERVCGRRTRAPATIDEAGSSGVSACSVIVASCFMRRW